MSEREFLELLNLYLDREITAADADRLEREIRTDVGRHRTYLQYCRMQQGVRRLGVAQVRQAEDCAPGRWAVVRSATRAWWGSQWVWTGAVAAAVVLALVISARRPVSAEAAPEDLLAASGQKAELGLSGDALLLSTFPMSGSAPKVHEDQFDWMRQFQLVSLESRIRAQPLSSAAGGAQPVAPAKPNRALGDDATEMAAFKFVK
ncbi:MAG: hypothetical protein RLZZ447_2107 [Verrucomicrobiota bacterium]|jgi:hypothetical protein